MNEKEINDLINLGYSTSQISQIMKFESCNIPTKMIFNREYAGISALKDSDDFRTFRSIVGKLDITSIQKEHYFKVFLENLDYAKPIKAGLSSSAAVWILDIMLEVKRRELDVNIEPLFNKTYSNDFMRKIWYDILDGVDVDVYLNSTLPAKRKDLLRTALKDGINIEDDLIKFSFLTEKDIPNLKILIDNKYDYKDILKKFKDTKKTVLICEFESTNKTKLLPFINTGMSYDVIKEIGQLILDGKDVKMLKSIKISSVDSIDLYLKIHSLGYPLKKCKNYGSKTLSYIIEALNDGLKTEEIDNMITVDFTTTIPILLDCYRYKQPQYIDFIKRHESCFLIDYADNIKKLLKHNFENEKNVYDLCELLEENGKVITSSIFSFHVKLITQFGVDKEFFQILKNGNFSASQSKIIAEAKNAGYDISCMLDNRLSDEQLRSIKNCLDLGLKITKTKEYDLPEKKEKSKEESYKIRYSDRDSFYYEFEDVDGNLYVKYHNGKAGW